MKKQTLYCIKHILTGKYLTFFEDVFRYELVPFEGDIYLYETLDEALINFEEGGFVFDEETTTYLLNQIDFVIVELELREIKELD